MGRRKTIRYGREERRTVSHSYGNRRHVYLAYTDGECEIPDTMCVKKRRFNGKRRRCYAANREQPQIENSNEKHDIHCAIMVFMAEGHIALAGAMNREYAS